MESLFIQMMYKSQFRKIDPYDWFCGSESHIILSSVFCVKEQHLFEIDFLSNIWSI